MLYIVALIVGYLVGCFNTAYVISRMKHLSLQANGTGNLGASNTTTLLGWRCGVLVGFVDITKGVLVVLLFRFLLPDYDLIGLVSGVGCVLGHIFPFYLRFRGGKGFATLFGVIAATNWKLAIFVGLAILLVTFITDYIVLGTMTTVFTFCAYESATAGILGALILLPVAVIMIYKHLPNLARIFLHTGEEIGLRAAFSGKHRKK